MPHFTIRSAWWSTPVLVIATAFAFGAAGAGATSMRSAAAEPTTGLVVTVNKVATIVPDTPVTYRATVTNKGGQDVTNVKVTINVSKPFLITEAKGSKLRRAAIAQWQATVPAHRTVVFAVGGTFHGIPSATKVVTATGCVFVAGHVGPLVCDSAVNNVASAAAPASVWSVATLVWSVLSAALSLSALVILALVAFRRRRRLVAGNDS